MSIPGYPNPAEHLKDEMGSLYPSHPSFSRVVPMSIPMHLKFYYMLDFEGQFV